MKVKLVLFFIVSLITFFARSENYYVINVSGKVYCNEKLLKTGDKLTGLSVVRFTSENDKVYVLSPDKGNFILMPPENKVKNPSEWVAALENAAIPQNKFYRTATRSQESTQVFSDVYDLMGFFRDRVLLIGETRFNVNQDKIPLNQNNYFEFKNLSDLEKPVYLTCNNGSGFFTLEARNSESYNQDELEMVYAMNGKKIRIGTLKIVTKQRIELMNELAVFFKSQATADPSLVYFEQVLPYIAQAYGNTNLEVVREIITTDLNIPLKIRE
jgi:hypothetical protein